MSAHKRSSRRKRSTKHSPFNFRYIGIISFIVLLLALIKSGGLSQKGNVLGIRFLAQDMTLEQQQMTQQAQQPQQQQPQNNPQPQQQPQQNSSSEQNPNPGTPQSDFRPLNQQSNPQQQYQQPAQQQTQQSQSQQGSGSTGNNNNPANSVNNQTVPPQFQPQYQQMQQQYQRFQQQWQQQAAQNGFQINAPVSNAAQQQLGQGGQGTNNQSGPQNSFALPSLNSFPTIRGQFFVSSANGTSNINLNDKNTNVILGSDNSLKAKSADGTEVAINKEALEKINTAIKLETGSEIAKSGNTFVMKRGQVEAETKFPISFNVATKTFSVQTAAGQKEVSVLPDQAVEKAIQSGVINTANTAQGQTSGSKVALTELNNQPVYQVEGTSKQKAFGFFPISISKTTYVSAENGNVVTTNQNIFSRFLDTISF